MAVQIHYTWGPKLVWSNNGTIHWRFEKRDHMAVDLDNVRSTGAEECGRRLAWARSAWARPEQYLSVRAMLPGARDPPRRPSTLHTPATLPPLQLPFVPLPPPWADGRYKTPSGRVGPQGAPTSLEDYNLIKFEAQLFNNGLKEMGGRRWKEVLGAEAAAARATGSESGGGG